MTGFSRAAAGGRGAIRWPFACGRMPSYIVPFATNRPLRRRIRKPLAAGTDDRAQRNARCHRAARAAAVFSSVAPRNAVLQNGEERRAVDRQLLPRVRITCMILVYRYRVKSLNGLLNKQSRAVNYVWNFCNDAQKLALDLVRRFDYIAVGNVSAVKLARTRMAKSVYDASWSSFRNKLRYKAIAHGATFEEVDESGSTQSCSSCGSRDSTTRPKGIAGLRVREWACSDCGVEHDRDINAALNILRCGRASPGVGILSLWGEEDVKVMSCASGSAGLPPRAVRAPPAIETSCRGQ